MPIVLLVDWQTTGRSFFTFSRDELPVTEAPNCNQQDLQKDRSVSGEKLLEPEASRANKKGNRKNFWLFTTTKRNVMKHYLLHFSAVQFSTGQCSEFQLIYCRAPQFGAPLYYGVVHCNRVQCCNAVQCIAI